MHFWRSNICSDKLDVQETNCCFSQFNRPEIISLDNDVHKRHKPQKKNDVIKDIDSVPSNVESARQEALLYVFKDNEAVNPAMRHVS